VRRGHEVGWYSGQKYARAIAASGARHLPFAAALDYDDADLEASFPGRAQLRGLQQIRFDVRQIFIGQIEGQLQDLQALHAEWPADAVLAEQTLTAALLHTELGGPPCALLGVLPLGIWSRDTAPFGLGVLPSGSPTGQLRNAALHWAAQHLIFGDASRELRALCLRIGVKTRAFMPPVSPHLMLQASVPGFEYPARDQPRQLHFIGPITPPAPTRTELPDWWPEVLQASQQGRAVVLVTQGTLATDAQDLIWPTLRALAHEPVLVIAAGLKVADSSQGLPANARSCTFIPFSLLLPHVRVMVSNGGYGAVQQALVHGVPVVVAGTSEDKAEVANRVQYAGVGMNLRTRRPTAAQLHAAVLALLGAGPQRSRAAKMGAEMRLHDAPAEAASLLELLAESGAPVMRPGPL
jgi:UDP:flavonoid glycosyltransferase YjiC (YdhE family)